MLYIHNSDLQSHGNLKSTNCLVGSRVSLPSILLKFNFIFSFSLLLKSLIMVFHHFVVPFIKNIPLIVNNITNVNLLDILLSGKIFSFLSALLWSSPEVIRDPHAPIQGSQKGDVYSFSIILHEIIYRRGVFAMNETSVTPKEIFQAIKLGNDMRPPFMGDNTLYEIGHLMKRCWQENPNERPDFTSILSTIKKLSK